MRIFDLRHHADPSPEAKAAHLLESLADQAREFGWFAAKHVRLRCRPGEVIARLPAEQRVTLQSLSSKAENG